MRHILIINPNTSDSVTALLKGHAQKEAGAEVHVQAVTARFGAPYISCEASYAVAGHATLDAWASTVAQDAPLPDAVLIGCFGDPGLFALREASAAPVTGLAEAAFAEATAYGRFAIVTGGQRWKPMLERIAGNLGYGPSLGGIVTVEPTGAQLAQDPLAARVLLAEACLQAVRQLNVQSVILGGAGLAGLAAQVQAQVGVPVIDSVLAGIRQTLLLAAQPPADNVGRSNEIGAWLGKF
ncbi:MAG: aspartate/glutamate racemase family protein [Pseudomonadota bacterium]